MMRIKKKKKLGVAFKDELAKVSSKSGHFQQNKDSTSWSEQLLFGWQDNNPDLETTTLRKFIFIIVIFVTLSSLALRLFHLQITQGRSNKDLADSNRIQVKIIHAPRGVIYDRNGKILAQNEPGFRVLEQVEKGQKAKFISRDEALNLEAKNDPQFKNLEVDSIRSYPYGKTAASIIGYVGEITKQELKDPKYKNYQQAASSLTSSAYKLGDKVGRSGVEQTYEPFLRGIDGGEVVEVDAQGKKIRTLRQIDPIPGQDLVLTIDNSLQSEVYKNLAEGAKKVESCCGVAIAEDPSSGEILSLVSIPSFDPEKVDESLTDINSPFLNRAIAGTYPPGSIFKIVTSAAALSSGKISPNTQFEDTGVMALGEFTFANWYYSEYGRKEGMVNLVKAIQRSNDIYFYHVGQIIGENLLGNTAKKLGLGHPVGIDLPGEASGLIPDDNWKQKTIGTIWYPGDTLHMAIGQGYVLTTPLQLNVLTSEIAQNGNFYPPHLALKITSPGGGVIKEFTPAPKKVAGLTQNQINIIKQGLSLVPENGGTAWPMFTFPIKTAGKTGTAEFGSNKKTHAWYTTYAPVESPTIALTVLVEGGGEGSSVSGPIAKEILRWYFSPDKKNLIKDIYPVATESAKTLGE